MQLLKDVIIIGAIHSSQMACGGIVGANVGGNITQCNNENAITGRYYVGGIVGLCETQTETGYISISSCNNKGVITSTGIFSDTGYNNGSTGPYNATHVGGIVGSATRTNITLCKNNQIVNSTADTTAHCIGGIVGDLRNGTISRCINEREGIIGTKGKYYVIGGIVGYAVWQVTIEECCNMGEVASYDSAGGIAGCAIDCETSYCYNLGKITSISAGGIIANSASFEKNSSTHNSIKYCYNRGSISGESTIGSIVGYIVYSDNDYLYALNGTCDNIFGKSEGNVTTNKDNTLDKTALINMMLSSEFSGYFKEDYTGEAGEDSINDGFPIFSWQ